MMNKPLFALLFAGLFLSKTAIASTECQSVKGQTVQFLTFENTLSCAGVTSQAVQGAECKLVPTQDYICAGDNNNWTGGPYVFTGDLFVEEDDGVISDGFTPTENPEVQSTDFSQVSNSELSSAFSQTMGRINGIASDLGINQSKLNDNLGKTANELKFAITRARLAATRAESAATQAQVATQITGSKVDEINNDANLAKQYALAANTNIVTLKSDNYTQHLNFDNKLVAVSAQTIANGEAITAVSDESYAQFEYLSAQMDAILTAAGGGEGGESTIPYLQAQTSILGTVSSNIQGQNNILNTISSNTANSAAYSQAGLFLMADLKGIGNTTNTKLDTLITAVQSGSSGGGSGGEFSDTITHEKLDGISETLDGIAENTQKLSDAFKEGSGQKTGPDLCSGPDCYKGKSWVQPKYAEGMKTVYDAHKEAFQGSSIHTYLEGFAPKLSGSAPTEWQFCLNFHGMADLGCHTASLSPNVISFVRLVILISAGFLCRRLIFGG